MPKIMEPSKEIWEQLGFTFSDNLDNNHLYDATLPIGWSLIKANAKVYKIYDENGLARGGMYYDY